MPPEFASITKKAFLEEKASDICDYPRERSLGFAAIVTHEGLLIVFSNGKEVSRKKLHQPLKNLYVKKILKCEE